MLHSRYGPDVELGVSGFRVIELGVHGVWGSDLHSPVGVSTWPVAKLYSCRISEIGFTKF